MGCIRNSNNYAVSEVVGYVVILAIIISTVSIVFIWYQPTIDRQKAENQTEAVCSMLYTLNSKTIDLLDQGANASTSGSIKMEKGSLYIDPEGGERIIVYYSYNDEYDFYVKNFDDEDLKSFDIKFEEFLGDSFFCYAIATILSDWDREHCKDDIEISNNNYHTFEFDCDLNKMVRINLYNSILDHKEIFGSIWIFDIGALRYELNSNYGTFKAICENNGIIYSNPYSSNIWKEPLVHSGNDFVFRIFQINSTEESVISVSGTTETDFSMRLNNTYIYPNYVYESGTQIFYPKIQVYGDYSELWLDFFKSYHEDFLFYDLDNPTNTIYHDGSIEHFSLVQTIIDFSMGVD